MTMEEFQEKGGEEWFKQEFSKVYGVKKQLIKIIGIYEGSVIVVFEITDS